MFSYASEICIERAESFQGSDSMQISSNLTSRGGAVKQLRNLSLPEVPERTIIARTLPGSWVSVRGEFHDAHSQFV
jgi:hypothetical protein